MKCKVFFAKTMMASLAFENYYASGVAILAISRDLGLN